MSMAVVMSEMPDVWRKVLAEHVPDGQQYCRACFHDGGRASWPCQTYRIAQEAKWVAEGGLPGTGPHGPGPSRTRLSPPEPSRQDDFAVRHGHGAPATGPSAYPATGPSAYPATGATSAYPATGGTSAYPTTDSVRAYPTTGGTSTYPSTGSWSSPSSGDPLSSSGDGWSVPSRSIGADLDDRPFAGDPLGAPSVSASAVTGEQSYGSTFDAPYGSSFGIDDRPHASRW